MKIERIIGAALALFTAASIALAADPTIAVLKWDHPPGAEYFRAEDTNGVPSRITYRIRHATELTTPATNWPVVATTTNNGVTVSNLPLSANFFIVEASNSFFVSLSDYLSRPSPTGQIERLRFIVP